MSWLQYIEYGRTSTGRTSPAVGARASFIWPEGVERPGRVVGIIVASDFPDEEIVRSVLTKGAEREPESTVFVVRGKPTSKDAARWAVDALRAAGRDPILAESNRAYWGNHAGNWRDAELANTVDMLLVFHDKKSATSGKFVGHDHAHVIERGAPRKKYQRRGRKPIGA